VASIEDGRDSVDSVRNGKKPGGERATWRGSGKEDLNEKKTLREKLEIGSDSPWKPWTLIARWRSRCKSAFPTTVMIAGMVAASTSASQTVPRRTPQPREKQSITSRLRDYAHRTAPFSPVLPVSLEFDDADRGTALEIIVVDTNAISVRVYLRNAILIAYASVQKNADLRVRVSNCWYAVAINRRISLGRKYY